MLRGEIVGLRAVQDSDIEVYEAELMNDVDTRMRSDSRPWRPVAPGSAKSQYREAGDAASSVPFAVVELATSELVGEAVLSPCAPGSSGRAHCAAKHGSTAASGTWLSLASWPENGSPASDSSATAEVSAQARCPLAPG